MAAKKEKSVTVETISTAIAKKLGASRAEVHMVVKEVFPELFAQLQEVGLVKIPHFGKFRFKIPINSGHPRPLITFRQSPTWSKWAKATMKDPKYKPFIEFIVERDTAAHDIIENRRVRRVEWIKGIRQAAWDRERVRIATKLGEMLGQTIDPKTIPQEALTPPRIRYIRLPDHPVGLRDMLVAHGVLEPLDPPVPENPEDANQQNLQPVENPPE
jgi:hypothetical protein